MDLSIIISASRPARLRQALLALAKSQTKSQTNTQEHTFELIVVSESLTNDWAKQDTELQNLPYSLKVLTTKTTHPSEKRNRGAKAAHGEVLAFLDDDADVTPMWVSTAVRLGKDHPDTVWGGPNCDLRQDWKFRIAQRVQEHPLLEGLQSHVSQEEKIKEVDIHSLPLCNMVVSRQVFFAIDGFNDRASYFIDDVEFNFIAKKMGYRLCLHRDLFVQHDVRPLVLPYLRYKFQTRRQIGKIYSSFPELYADSKLIKLIFVTYVGFAACLLFLPTVFFVSLVSVALIAYSTFLVGFTLGAIDNEKPKQRIYIGLLVFLVQALSYSGFTIGLLESLLWYSRFQSAREFKKTRYQKFSGV